MSGFLSAYSETVRVDVDPERGYWVELKKYISFKDKEKADRALQHQEVIIKDDGTREGRAIPDVATYRALMVHASIDSWNLDDVRGNVWPIDMAHVKALPGVVFDRLWTIIDEMGDSGTPEERVIEQRRFPDDGEGGVSTEDVIE